jgi:isopenicillin N synthase-like dioxygenase
LSLPVFRLEAMEQPGEVRRLGEACEAVGFFYVAEHGVDRALEHRLERDSAAFFGLPLADKQRIAMARGGAAWRGYFPVGGELTSGVPDLKEGLYFGDELAPGDPRAGWPMHGANLFPDEPRRLREVVPAYMQAQERIGQRVLRALAMSLGLDPAYFATHLTHRPTNLFRIFHYPPAGADPAAWGVGEHTDYGLLTLLKQDDRGGLEVKTAAGRIDAPPIAGTLVCNLGDMLDRLTGGRFRSTPHRVRNRSGASRSSWPFFLDPAFDAQVAPLPGAQVRPAALDAAERWDRASVHTLSGTYGDYLRAKVARVFPALTEGDL